MSISGVGSANSYIYKNVNTSNNRNKGTALFGRTEITTASNSCGVSEQSSRFSANDAYNSMTMNGKFRSRIGECYLQGLKFRNVNLLVQSKGEVQKVDNEKYSIDVSDEIAGYWCIHDKEMGQSMTFDPMSTSIQTDENTGKDYIVSCDPWGGLIDVMYADDALVEGIKTFIHTDQVTKSVLNDKYSIEVHAYTGIEVLKVKGREGNGSWLMMSGDRQQIDKLQELADLYKEKYPNLVKSDGLAMGLAEAEVAGQVVRTENGILTIACNGIQYMDNNDQSKGWGFIYSENDADIYNEIMQAIIEGSIKGGIESVSGWEEWFQEKGHTYERIFSDEEYKDKPVEVSDVKQPPSLGGLDGKTKVTEIGVASLKDFSFYFNEDTGEISCISHYNNQPGRHPLWSKHLSAEERERCDKLFDNYKDVAAGGFVFRYRAYLMHEEFWDMYLEGKVDLSTLMEHDDTLSENELYNKFLLDAVKRDHRSG